MVWDRFHFLCRRYHQLLQSGEVFREAVVSVESANGVELYGKPFEKDTIPSNLIFALKALSDPQQIKKITNIYGQLDFSNDLEEPPKLRKAKVYVTFVAIVFFMVYAIYQFFVTPVFTSMFEAFQTAPTGYMAWYVNNWYLPIVVVFVCIAILFAICSQINKLYKFKVFSPDSVFYRFFIPNRIKNSYSNIIEIVSFPLSEGMNQPEQQKTIISRHLEQVENSDLITEIHILLRREGKNLAQYSEHFILSMMVVIFILIIISIFFFLSSAYAPIFMMGELV